MILIAEDDENDAITIAETLKAAGVKDQLRWAANGTETIAYLKGELHYADRTRHPLPAVLLLDLRMPRIGGFEVLEWIKRAMPTRDILIVILSGLSGLEDVRRGYELGARSFLSKPARLHDINLLVRSYSTYWQMENHSESVDRGFPDQRS